MPYPHGFRPRMPVSEKQISYAIALGIENPQQYPRAVLSEFMDYMIKRNASMRVAEQLKLTDMVAEDATPHDIDQLIRIFCEDALAEAGILDIGVKIMHYGKAYFVEKVWPDTAKVTLRPIEGGRAHAYDYVSIAKGLRR